MSHNQKQVIVSQSTFMLVEVLKKRSVIFDIVHKLLVIAKHNSGNDRQITAKAAANKKKQDDEQSTSEVVASDEVSFNVVRTHLHDSIPLSRSNVLMTRKYSCPNLSRATWYRKSGYSPRHSRSSASGR